MCDLDLVESYSRFDIETEKEEILKHLDEFGYAVIKSVASEHEVNQGIEYLWDFLENLPECTSKRNDSSTWDGDEWYPSPRNGILNAMGTGQCGFAWQARLLPKVKKTFSAIWETDDLITSFDGVNVFRPWVKESTWKTKGGWWHVDQNGYFEDRRGRISVQGLVSYTAASKVTGGLCVLAGSHKKFTEMCLRNEIAYMEGNYLKADETILNDKDFEKRLVCCDAGDLIIWDSRTVHCNTPGHDDMKHLQDPNKVLRACAYVCMTPLAWASKETLEARRAAFINNESTTHWPHIFTSAGGKACAHYLPLNNLSVLTSTTAQEQESNLFQFKRGISIQQRLLIDGNIQPESYAQMLYQYFESTVTNLCLIS